MENADPLDTAARSSQHIVFGQCEDDRCGAGDQIEKGWCRLAAIGFRIQFVGVIVPGAAEPDFPGFRMRQIDHVGRGPADAEPVDLAFKLVGEIVASKAHEGRKDRDGLVPQAFTA